MLPVQVHHCQLSAHRIMYSVMQLPYKFREHEGLFSSHTQYGAIKLKQFSLLGETAPEDTDTLCTAFICILASPLTVDFHLL